jgi:hypothetical protein
MPMPTPGWATVPQPLKPAAPSSPFFTLEQAAHAGFTKKAEEAPRKLAQAVGNHLGKAPTHSCVEGRTLLFVLTTLRLRSWRYNASREEGKQAALKAQIAWPTPLVLTFDLTFCTRARFRHLTTGLLACCTDHNWSVKLEHFTVCPLLLNWWVSGSVFFPFFGEFF